MKLGRRGAAFRGRVPPRGLLALGLAMLVLSLAPWSRLAGAETTTPAVQRSASDDAIARWTERAKVSPDDREAWVSLGDAFMQKARESADPGYYRRAEAAYQKALASGPPPVGALAGLAWVHGALHDFEQSAEWARKALKIDPGYGAAHGLLGDAALEMGDYDAAFEHYQKMLDIRPDLASYSRGAQLLWVTGDTRKAVWLMEKAVKAGAPYAENTAWARAQLALMLWSQGALLSAEQTLEAAREATPRNPHVLATMARVKTARGDYAAAIDYYQRAIAVVPRLETVIALGAIYAVTGQTAETAKQYALVEAINRLNRASGIRDDLDMLKFYADHDRNLGQAVEEAEAVFRTRKNVYAADTLAWCYYKAGRYEEARKVIRKALARRSPDAEILFHAGMIHAKLGDRAHAQKYLYQALSLDPHFHPVHATTAAATLAELGARPAE
ncbi:MAG: tetratricopeptide repeat protein [Candidatus Rokuibacteriota bacterium]